MILNDKIYNILKWLLIIVVPATITLIGGIGTLYNYDTTKIITIISLISTFVGAVTGVSNNNYYKDKE